MVEMVNFSQVYCAYASILRIRLKWNFMFSGIVMVTHKNVREKDLREIEHA
jgi:hypothetical protein